MKIGFMGGTFSPPHIGHLNAAKVFYEEEQLDLLIIIPAKVSPFKAQSEATSSDTQRFEMSQLCFLSLQKDFGYNIEVSPIEMQNESISYTYLTIRALKSKYENCELVMYVGSDMFFSLEKWKNSEEIFSNCKIYTRCRENGETERMLNIKDKYSSLYNAHITVSLDKEIVVSSTYLREQLKLKNYANCQKLLTDEVLRYIIDNRLYFQENYEQ